MVRLRNRESCLLGTALLLGFTVYSTSSQVDLLKNPGCLGNDLIQENELQKYNASSNDYGGIYISTSNPVQCSGRVVIIETCGYLPAYNETRTGDVFLMWAFLLRYQQSTRKYVQVGLFQLIRIFPTNVNWTTHTYCYTQEIVTSNNWIAQNEDVLGVYIQPQCFDSGSFLRCPAQPVIIPTQTNQSAGILYYNTTALFPTETIKLEGHLLSTSNALVNIRASVEAIPEEPKEEVNVEKLDVNLLLTITTILIVLAMIFILVICAMIVLFNRYRQKVRDRETLTLSLTNEVSDSVAMPEIQINPRGIMRRTLSRHRSVSVLTPSTSTRSRIVSTPNDYSRVVVQDHSEQSQSTDSPIEDPFLHCGERQTQELNKALLNYEVGFGDYAAPIFYPANKSEELTQQLETIGVIEVPEEQLEFEEELGSGQFGTVYKALWTYPESLIPQDDIPNLPKAAQVAVKVMEGQLVEDRIKFLQEAVLLGQFNDPNIVAIFGVVTTSTRLMMICELMDRDLRNQLHMCRSKLENYTSTPEDYHTELPAMLLSYSRKIASSMVYLGLKGFVHRDLAARNILVSNEGDCKISDFGMSRDLQDETYYMSHEGMVPVKWTAPEAVKHKKYSFKSDVWSYGILLYEIWSLGYKPYHDMSNMEVVAKVETGYRLPPPPGCPRNIYSIMIRCTHPETKARPTFTQILVDLQRPDYQLLKWTADNVRTSSEAARILGAPLGEGFCLYKDLQSKYLGLTAVTSV